MFVIREHKIILLENGMDNIEQQQEKLFPAWFYSKIYELHQKKMPGISEELFSLASGSMHSALSYSICVINGAKFVASKRDKNRKTQNNGVCVPGVDENNFYGQLQEVLVNGTRMILSFFRPKLLKYFTRMTNLMDRIRISCNIFAIVMFEICQIDQ